MAFKLSAGAIVFLMMLVTLGISVAVWLVTLQTGQRSATTLAERLRNEAANHIANRVRDRLEAAETVTSTNSRMFSAGAYVIPDRADPRGVETEAFLTAMRAQLYGSRQVTTVSMTDYRGNLFGVYINAADTVAGRWEQFVDPDPTKAGVLLDYKTFPRNHPREGAIDNSSEPTVTNMYNSAEQVWYTLVNVSDPEGNAWTPMYTMGDIGQVSTMFSHSRVAFRPNGALVGVVSIDMATGFVSFLLQSLTRNGMTSFVVDALAGTRGVLLGSSVQSEALMVCNLTGVALNKCPVADQLFKQPFQADDATTRAIDQHVRSALGGWANILTDLRLTVKDNLVSIDVVRRANLRWLVVTVVPTSSYMGEIDANTVKMIVVAVVTGVVQLALCVALGFGIRRPLRALDEELYRLRTFDVGVDGDNEEAQSLSIISEVADLQRGHTALKRHMRSIKSYVPPSLLAQMKRGRRFADGSFDDGDDIDEEDDCEDDEDMDVMTVESGEGRRRQSEACSSRPGGLGATLGGRDVSESSDRGVASSQGRRSSVAGRSASSRASFLGGTRNILPTMGVARRVVSIVAVNLRDFNQYALGLVPHLLTKHMEDYVTLVVNLGAQRKGVLDFFQGDHAILSFNVVSPLTAHMRLAVCAAFDIATECHRTNLVPSIGVASSLSLVGNVGSNTVKRFGIIGAGYSLATHLERATRAYSGVSVLTTKRCMDDCTGSVECELVDVAAFPGCPRTAIATPRSVGLGADAKNEEEWMYMLQANNKKASHNDRFNAFLDGNTLNETVEPVAEETTGAPTPRELLARLIANRVDGRTYTNMAFVWDK